MSLIAYEDILEAEFQEPASVPAASRFVDRRDPDTAGPISAAPEKVEYHVTLAELNPDGEVEFVRDIDLCVWKPLLDEPLEIRFPESASPAMKADYSPSPR